MKEKEKKKKEKQKTSMVEKETRKGENMGEAGHKIGNGEEGGGMWEGRRRWERAAPVGVSGQGLWQGRLAAPQSCWLFKKSRVLNLSSLLSVKSVCRR